MTIYSFVLLLFLFVRTNSLVAKRLKWLPLMRETWVSSLGREDPLERKWQPAPVFLPGKSHGLRSLLGYSPWGRKKSDTTKRLHFHFHFHSAYKVNKLDDNIQPWRTPFPIWNQSVVPCPVLTVASWPVYRFLKRQVRWHGIPISFKIFHSLLWSTQSKALAYSIKQK